MPSSDNQFTPIAIIGMGCRFPQAANVSRYWQMLLDGVDAITEIPANRWDVDAFYDPRPSTPCKTNTRGGGFLSDLDQFDPFFFGISPREASRLDPQQRLLLETTWEAMEYAGLRREQFLNSHTGVFMGVCTDDYVTIERSDLRNVDIYLGTGGSRDSIAGRVAFVYGLTGPVAAIDSACSSSLVAVHQACNSLQLGDCEMALAGGVNVVLHPGTAIAFSQANLLSPDSRCKAFDARANGFVRSEGAGVVLLKPLARALADGDPVYAVIKGTASNNDGASSPFMTPSRQGQTELLRQIYSSSNIDPDSVQYVEAHGTGTAVGDPIEVGALSTVFGHRDAAARCVLGSAKTNIGHLEAAAGVAGLIKTVLCLGHRTIPRNLHFETPNPNIPWADTPFVVPTETTPWPATTGAARAGVNSFGISGTNAHVVLEEAPAPPVKWRTNNQVAQDDATAQHATPSHEAAQTLLLSAHTPEVLREVAHSYRDALSDIGANEKLLDICYSAAARRTQHEHRVGVIASTAAELVDKLDRFVADDDVDGIVQGSAVAEFAQQPVFLFSGIGTQWLHMGHSLRATEPVFRKVIDACEVLIRKHAAWSLTEVLDDESGAAELDRIDVMQPAIFSVQVALAALWQHWGVLPSAVIGHSLGEIAASYVAGALSLDDAVRIVCIRSRLMCEVGGQGRMAAVGLSADEARARIAHLGDAVCVSVVNAPTMCTISGNIDAVESVVQMLETSGVFCKLLAVDVACHSNHMDGLLDRLVAKLEGICPSPASLPLYSSLRGGAIGGEELTPEYWAVNLRDTVRFDAAFQAALRDGHRVFLELSPHPALLAPARQNAKALQCDIIVTPSLRMQQPEREQLLEAASTLFVHGAQVEWPKLFPDGAFVPPPPYAWQRERFWFSEEDGLGAWNGGTLLPHANSTGHPLLGTHFELADAPGTHCFQSVIDLKLAPWWSGHGVEGMTLFPAAGYVELALAASMELFGPGPRVIRDIELRTALFLSPDTPCDIQLIVSQEGRHARRIETAATVEQAKSLTFHFYARDGHAATGGVTARAVPDDEHTRAGWRLLALGTVDLPGDDALHSRPTRAFSGEQLNHEMASGKNSDAFYASVITGFSFDGAFRGVQRTWDKNDYAVTELSLPVMAQGDARNYRIHPALLDGAFHSLLAIGSDKAKLSLPFAIGRVEIFALPQPAQHLWCEIHSGDTAEGYRADVGLYDDAGHCLLFVSDYNTKVMETKAVAAENAADWLYDTCFEEIPHGAAPATPAGSWLVIGEDARASAVCDALAARGASVTRVPLLGDQTSAERILSSFANAANCRGIVFSAASMLHSIPASSSGHVAASAGILTKTLLELLQRAAATQWLSTPRVFVLTESAKTVAAGGDVPAPARAATLAQAPLAGLARVAAVELRELHVTQVDVDADTRPQDVAAELLHADAETEVAHRGGKRFAFRLRRLSAQTETKSRRVQVSDDAPLSYRLESAGGGVFDDLKLHVIDRRSPAAGEVEVRVAVVGLNFLDVLKALNMAPGLPEGARFFGMECAGRVVAVGANVDNCKVGDEVVVMDASGLGCFQAFVTTDATLVLPKPAHLSLVEAVTIPVAYQTAWYGLSDLGRLREGESILIHSAAGGVGLAALEIAQQRGAIVYATAGTEEKREMLRKLGVPYVMNSRTLDFAKEVMAFSNGRGVDMVLNSLAGEAIPQSLALLATGGRFIEIGKRDIYADSQLGLLPFQRNLSFFAVDLLRMRLEKPAVVEELTRDVAEHMWSGAFKTLPHTVFPVSETSDAFRYMAKGTHSGKIVIALDDAEVDVVEPTATVPVRADAEYLITGGLGALGLEFAQYLVAEGARHLTLIGRRAPSDEAARLIAGMRAEGATISVERCDIAQADAVTAMVRRVRERGRECGIPIGGLLHAAGITDDKTLLQLAWSNFETVFAAKVAGALNLHEALQHDTLDFFVLFSSTASVMGGAGQANYAAANAFLDALARVRRQAGLPAHAINWGPWADVGMAALDDMRGARLADRGLLSIPVKEGTESLKLLLQQPAAQIVVMPVDWPRWAESFPEAVHVPFFAALQHEFGGGRNIAVQNGIREQIAHSGRREAGLELLVSNLRADAARILRVPEDRLNVKVSLTRFGLDSLMAVELKNRIESDLQVHLSTAKLLQGPSVVELAELLIDELFSQQPVNAPMAALPPPHASVPPALPADPVVDVDALSDAEVASMLEAMLQEHEPS